MAKVTRSFAAKVAAQMGAPVDTVFAVLSQWEPWENANAAFNPLATTQHATGSRPLGGNPKQNNGNPVQEYPNEDIGAAATAQTLMNGHYPDIVNWLKTGQVGDTAKVAGQLRTWGTTGFANKVGGGKVTTSATSGGTTDDGVFDQSDYDAWMKANGPTKPKIEDYPDQDIPGLGKVSGRAEFDKAMTQYFAQLGHAATAYNAIRGPAAKGVLTPDQKRQQDITNKIAMLDAGVRAGTLDANEARDQLTAFISEQNNALQLGQQQLTAHAELDKYGPGGDFSYNDLGGAFQQYAKDNKIDPTSSGLKFTTPTPFDPVAAYKSNAELMGAGAGPPGGPQAGDITQQIQDLLGGGGESDPVGVGGGIGAAINSAFHPQGPGAILPNSAPAPNDSGYPDYNDQGGQAPSAIRPTGVDQAGNPVKPAPSQYSKQALGHIVPSIAARGGGG